MNIFRRSLLLISLLAISFSCQDENVPASKGSGYLKLSVSAISIASSPASGRVSAVSTDDFIVKIFRMGEADPVLIFNPWSTAPAEIELETGEYYAEAQNLDPPAPAAFDQPWYYGISSNFTIDKEELKEITIECTMANYKVAFEYSQNVLDNFTNWTATATRAISGQSLVWPKEESREGYFLIGEALSIHVHLAYQKQFEPAEITRDFYTTIDVPNAATLYRLKVDAILSDGEIQLIINVDDSFETVEIELGDTGAGDNENWTPGESWMDSRDGQAYETVQIGAQVWMAENLKLETPTGSWWYNNDANIGAIYGRMYTWEAAMDGGVATYAVPSGVQGVCPNGWHIPSLGEWGELGSYLGGQSVAGGKLKEAGTEHWNAPNDGATNETGFNGLPNGWYPQLPGYGFSGLGVLAVFHTSSENTGSGPVMAILHKDNTFIGLQSPNINAVAVRCVKD